MGSDTTAIIIAYRKGLDIEKFLQSLELPKNLPEFFFNCNNFKKDLVQFHEWIFNYDVWYMYSIEEKAEALNEVEKVFFFEEEYEILINYFDDDEFCREENEWSDKVMNKNCRALFDVEKLINERDEGVAVLGIADPHDDISTPIFRGIDFLFNKNDGVRFRIDEIEAKIINFLEEHKGETYTISEIYINVFVAAGYWRDKLLADDDHDEQIYVNHPLFKLVAKRIKRMVNEDKISGNDYKGVYYYRG